MKDKRVIKNKNHHKNEISVMLRDSFFKKRSVQEKKKRSSSPVPSIWPGISSPHGNGVTGKARHLAVSAVHEKGEPRKGRPIGHKKGIQKDASVLGRTIWERLHLSKPHPPKISFSSESTPCCDTQGIRSASELFRMDVPNTCRLQSRRRRPCFARSTV